MKGRTLATLPPAYTAVSLMEASVLVIAANRVGCEALGIAGIAGANAGPERSRASREMGAGRTRWPL